MSSGIVTRAQRAAARKEEIRPIVTHDYALRCKASKEKKALVKSSKTKLTPIALFEPNEAKEENVDIIDLTRSPETKIEPIPLIYEDKNDEVETTPPNRLSEVVQPKKKVCFRLDLPSVFHVLKSGYYKHISKNAEDKLKYKPELKKGRCTFDELMTGLSLDESENETLLNTDNLDSLLDSFTTTYSNPHDNSICDKSQMSSFVSSCPNGALNLSKENFQKLASESIEIDPWEVHSDLTNLALKMDCLDIEDAFTPNKVPTTNAKKKTEFLNISATLKLSSKKLKQLSIFPESPITESFRSFVSNLFPDTMKQLAFSFYQKGDLNKCVYYLSECHGSYLRNEILDKHSNYFCRPDEFQSSTLKLNPVFEQIKLQKFHQQSDDLVEFAKTTTSFQENLDKLDPNWNIIQITPMFPVHNRFSGSFVTDVKTPPLFLTCFLTLPDSSTKHHFVTYVHEPATEIGVSKTGILSEFKKVILKNRTINEKYLGDRKQYWNVRDEHNRELQAVVNAMQENWLAPWYFLLPGTISDEGIRKKIHTFIRAIEVALSKKLTYSQKIAFYKLVENYHILGTEMQSILSDLVSVILESPKEKLQKISEKLIEIAGLINKKTERFATILVIDGGLEQLPWDWLPCLRATTVTRVQSMSIMYSLFNLLNVREPVDTKLCTYVLNPDGSLKSVQSRLDGYFKSRKTWTGFAGAKPASKDIDLALQKDDIFLYCGHGSGQTLYPDFQLQKIYCHSIPILMGCGSAAYKYVGSKIFGSSVVNSYCVAACPSVVGFLWEITDVECDRVTVELLERWSPGNCELPIMTGFDHLSKRPETSCLATAVRFSRKGATQFLTECSIVNYGLPVKKY